MTLMPEGEFQGAGKGIKVILVTHEHSALHVFAVD